MTYLKPSVDISSVGPAASSDSDYVAVDVHTSQGTANNPYNIRDYANQSGTIVATEAGYGVRYRVIGDSDGADNAVFDIEILDAMPMRRIVTDDGIQATDAAQIRYDSDDDLLTTTNEYVAFDR